MISILPLDSMVGCLGYLLDKDCYASLVVLLTQIQQSSLSYSRRLLLMFVKPGLHISRKDRKHMVGNVYFKVPKKRNFLFSLRKEHKKIGRLPFTGFSISYLVPELQSFEDAKIKAESTDTKHAIPVTSHTLNKYSLDSEATISPNLPVRTN